MPKWNINLIPNSTVQSKSLEGLSAPFGYNLETTSPHVEAPKKK